MKKIKFISCNHNCAIIEEAIKLSGLRKSESTDNFDCVFTSGAYPIIAQKLPTIIDFYDFENETEVLKLKQALELYENIVLVRVPSLECKTFLISENLESNRKIVIRPSGYDATMFNITKRKTSSKLRVGAVGPAWSTINSLSSDIQQDIQLSLLQEPDAPVTYFDLDIVIAESEKFKPWNSCVLKAMACGAFPIVTNTEGIKMILHNDGIGNVCSPDSESVKQNMLMAYTSWKQSADFLANLGRRASKAARKYNWNKFVDLLVDDLVYLKEEC